MANKTEQRKAFSFLRSYYDVLDDIPSDTEKLEYLMAILNRQFKGIEPTFVGVWSKALYKSQRHAIEKSAEGWESKTGQQLYQPTQDPSVGPTQGPCQDPYQQEEEKEQVKEEVQVQVQVQEQIEEQVKNKNKDIDRILHQSTGAVVNGLNLKKKIKELILNDCSKHFPTDSNWLFIWIDQSDYISIKRRIKDITPEQMELFSWCRDVDVTKDYSMEELPELLVQYVK
jgi:hypothetical protein